ncbi:MAG: SagB/ThcOx family dehydrogenase [Candidatus Omnitrophica bacterium]|nr:SagB/ThcOx family dehydrogenase [Candidatus Omnitrophota bacterium]
MRYLLFLYVLINILNLHSVAQAQKHFGKNMKIKLDQPSFQDVDFKTLLDRRYSCRNFQNRSLKLKDVSSILWATYGMKADAVTHATRTVLSAGATYPLELYLLVGPAGVDKLKGGLYHYIVEEHALKPISEIDKRRQLAQACLGQSFIEEAPVTLVIVARFQRTTYRYGDRGRRYVYMEAGHAAQNAYLAITSLGLATVEVGAFEDETVNRILDLQKDYVALLVMPIGYPFQS